MSDAKIKFPDNLPDRYIYFYDDFNRLFREKTEWHQNYSFSTDEPHLPRVLLVGDSIVAGTRDAMSRILDGRASVNAFSSSKIVGDPGYSYELATALGDDEYDLVVFNNGLHGLEFDDEFYRVGLRMTIEYIRQRVAAPLLWRNSTPITVKGEPSKFAPENDIVLRRNEIAAEVAAYYGIPVIDAYSAVAGRAEISAGDGYHYNEQGRELLANYIAGEILPYLGRKCYNINGFSTDFPGKTSWFGPGLMHSFTLNGIHAVLIEPVGKVAEGNPWYWRARWFGAFPNSDHALLKRGWYVAHIEINELYGSPEAMRRMDMFYEFLTSIGLAKTCALAGFSRGGIDVCNWTLRHPERVESLYCDNGVFDFTTWPCRDGSQTAKECCLKAWGLSEVPDKSFDGNSINHIDELAKLVPLLLVVSDADRSVMVADNSKIVEEKWRAAGGEMLVIHKPGVDHHPHGLPDPTPIVEFLEKHRAK